MWVISPQIGCDDFFSCKVSRAQVAISVYDLAIEKSPRTASIKTVLVIPLKVPKQCKSNNANSVEGVLLILRMSEGCRSSRCCGNNLSIYFPLKFGKDTKSEKKTAHIRLLSTQVIFPTENKPGNLLNARQPASRI